MTLAVEIQEVRTAEELDHVRELSEAIATACLHTCDFPMPNGASCREPRRRAAAPNGCAAVCRMRRRIWRP
jgi:hypothetical protein